MFLNLNKTSRKNKKQKNAKTKKQHPHQLSVELTLQPSGLVSS